MAPSADPPTEGERWARRELEALRAAGFRPLAVARFLAASNRRAVDTRRARPAVARQARAWTAAGAAGWIGLAAARVQPFRRQLGPGLAAWAVSGMMLDWHLGMAETPDGRPRPLGAADAATLARAWLAPAVARHPSPALCALGLASDVLDGRLARAAEPTRLGRDLEGVADAAFAGAAVTGLRRRGAIGRAAVAAEIGRFAVGTAYGLNSYFLRAAAPGEPVRRAVRAVAPIRAAGLLLAAAGRRRIGEPLMVLGSLAGVAAVTLHRNGAHRNGVHRNGV